MSQFLQGSSLDSATPRFELLLRFVGDRYIHVTLAYSPPSPTCHAGEASTQAIAHRDPQTDLNDEVSRLVVMQRNGSEWLKPLSVKHLKPEIPLACITTSRLKP
jgi:hypothetical protein